MSDTPKTAQQTRVAEMWGEGFVPLAEHPRIEFGEADIKVMLWKPIKVGGTDVPVLSIAEPTLEQLQQLDKAQGEMAKTRRLLMQVGGLTEKEAGAIGLRDITLMGQLIEAFTDTARATGA
jgi:hypothetical protein